jgi:hypothetical protein
MIGDKSMTRLSSTEWILLFLVWIALAGGIIIGLNVQHIFNLI